jgi:hypothetical protein
LSESSSKAEADIEADLVIVSDVCPSPEEDDHAQFMQRILEG